ncbi:MAG: uracil-DNA glycosylase [Gemmatimonadetes bacterium]|nr:uracil-DNA glycosylase [Gemmatimonadota bacterium]
MCPKPPKRSWLPASSTRWKNAWGERVEDRAARELARYLGQRLRLGGEEVYLSGLNREEVLRLARASVAGRASGAHGGAPAKTGFPSPDRGSGRATSPESPTASGTSSPTPLPTAALEGGYEDLRQEALTCTRCRLAEGRTQVVFSDGSPTGRLMVVGEAPGRNEDETGLPFVGQAGKLLDLMLASVGLSRRDTVYIGNVLKCRPPGNRNPLPDEIDACAPILRRQIELVSPEVLLAVGSFAAQWLTGTQKALGKLRGSVYAYQGVPLVVTYHPAALLRNPGWSRATWDDLQLLRQVMDGS